MVKSLQYIWQLLVLSSLVVLAGILIIQHFSIAVPVNTFVITVAAVTIINLTTFMVMERGIRKKDQGGVVILMAGIGIKFLLYLLYVLIVWQITKNLTNAFIITFFALYLIFTFFLVIHLFKLLINK
jgi:hypothetical protein